MKRFFTESIRREKVIGKLELSSKSVVKGSCTETFDQTKSRSTDDEKGAPVGVEPIEVLFDTFDVPIPRKALGAKLQTKRKRRKIERIDIKHKRKRYCLGAE